MGKKLLSLNNGTWMEVKPSKMKKTPGLLLYWGKNRPFFCIEDLSKLVFSLILEQ